MKMTQELADIHTKVVGGIYTPPTITVFVADLIREMGWNPDNFQFKKNPHLYIHVNYPRPKGRELCVFASSGELANGIRWTATSGSGSTLCGGLFQAHG